MLGACMDTRKGGIAIKTAVVFQSHYGSTKQYAQWIAEELSCDLWERKKIKAADLEPYHTIIYGGGLYAGGILGVDLLTKDFSRFCHKNLILFTCGLADPSNPSNVEGIQKIITKAPTPSMQEAFALFHLRGAIDYPKLGLIHKIMMAAVHNQVKKKDADSLSAENKEFLATYGKAVDFTDRASIMPIVHCVKKLESLGQHLPLDG